MKKTQIPLFVLILLVIGAALWPETAFAQALAAGSITIRQTPPVVANGTAQLNGPYDATQMPRLVFGLQPPHLAEEKQFLQGFE